LLATAVAWILSDWHVRTVRSVALLALACAVGIGIGYLLNSSWGPIAGASVGGLLALPVLLRHPLVTRLRAADAKVASELGDLERRLVRASRDLQRGQAGVQEYQQLIAAARERVRTIEPPDEEWADVLRMIGREIDTSLSVARGEGRSSLAEEIPRRRAFVRNAYRDLIRRRSRR
jgi:hypothetical protein